jgi:hypothetical protein
VVKKIELKNSINKAFVCIDSIEDIRSKIRQNCVINTLLLIINRFIDLMNSIFEKKNNN